MRTPTSTVIALVGEADLLAVRTRQASNLSVVEHEPVTSDDVLARHEAVMTTWRRAIRAASIFALVDIDPLAVVVDEWSKRMQGGTNDLEVAIGLVTERTPRPDYYFVPTDTAPPLVDWYLDFLAGRSANRIVPVGTEASAILAAIARLPFGPELPSASELAPAARSYVPLPQVAGSRRARWPGGAGTSE